MFCFCLNHHWPTDHTALHAAFSNRNETIRTMIIEVKRNGTHRCHLTSFNFIKCLPIYCRVSMSYTAKHLSPTSGVPRTTFSAATDAMLVPGWRATTIWINVRELRPRARRGRCGAFVGQLEGRISDVAWWSLFWDQFDSLRGSYLHDAHAQSTGGESWKGPKFIGYGKWFCKLLPEKMIQLCVSRSINA